MLNKVDTRIPRYHISGFKPKETFYFALVLLIEIEIERVEEHGESTQDFQ